LVSFQPADIVMSSHTFLIISLSYLLFAVFNRFTDLNLQSIMLSSITVSNCPALRRITITSNALRVCT